MKKNILNSYCVSPSLSVEPPSDGWVEVVYSVVEAVSVLYCCVEVTTGLLVESELLDVGVVVEATPELSVVATSWVVSRGDTVVAPPWVVSSDIFNEYHICLFLIR